MLTITSRTKAFSQLLQERLAELNMSVPQFAYSIGLQSTRRAYLWLNGAALPTSTRLRAIAWTLRLDDVDVAAAWLGILASTPAS
jgi:hypothetical protein